MQRKKEGPEEEQQTPEKGKKAFVVRAPKEGKQNNKIELVFETVIQ
jgi:hypothetical protein